MSKALLIAIAKNDKETVFKLLDNGADSNYTLEHPDPNYQIETGDNPLKVALRLERTELLPELFKRGAHPNTVHPNNKKSLLHLAIENNNKDFAKQLLSHPNVHLYLDHPDHRGLTPLMLA